MSNSKAYFEQEIRERASELGERGLDNALCIGLLSLSSYASSARASMLSQHLVQSLIPTNPEIPGVATGYEYVFGINSTGYQKATSDIKVVKKINRYKGKSYTLITYDEEAKRYDIIERNVVKNLAEEFGYIWNNETVDSLHVGDEIPEGTIIKSSPAFDEHMNFRYGVNAKAYYAISPETIEDAVVVSESFAKKLSTTYVRTCNVPINENDIPLNLYGNKNEYKSFPDIGEKTSSSIIVGVRRVSKLMSQYALKNKNLRRPFPDDDLYQLHANYQIADIDIWFNKPYDEFPKAPAYQQIKKYYDQLCDYYAEVYEFFGKIIENDEYTYTEPFGRLYRKAKDFLDPSCKYADDDGKVFSNIVMEFTIYRNSKLHVGCKISGRCGNKSIVAKVLPDKDMGVTDRGVVPDLRIDALGVLGRLNSMQSIDLELNWISEAVRERMKETDNIDTKIKLLLRYYHLASPAQEESLRKFIYSKPPEEREEWIRNTENERLITIQSPMYCASPDDLLKLTQEFAPQLSTIYYPDDDGELVPARHKVIVADEYIIRLKQEPMTKYSCRSKSMNNPRTSLPIKSTAHAKMKRVFPESPQRYGEQETAVMMLSGDGEAFNYFLKINSTSNEARRSTLYFTEDPRNGFDSINISAKNEAVDMLNAYLKTMGNRIEFEVGDDDIAPPEKVLDKYDMPKYIKNLFTKSDSD